MPLTALLDVDWFQRQNFDMSADGCPHVGLPLPTQMVTEEPNALHAHP